MAATNGASGDAGRGTPNSSKSSFHAARDGKQSEPEREPKPTQQQERAANKVARLEANKANEMEIQSAKSALAFNVRAEGLTQSKSTAEPKRQPQPSYKAKDGKTYTSLEAIAAAKNLDKQKAAQAKQETKVKKHHAPAPTPPGVARNAYRGRSAAQVQQTQGEQAKAQNDNSKLTAKQQRILARSLQREKQNGKVQQQSKEMGR